MSAITDEEMGALAKLSMLKLGKKETAALKVDIQNILGYVQTLDELNTDGVEPTYRLNDLKNMFRSDEVDQTQVGRDQMLALAPDSTDNQVKIPKVL